MFFLIVHILYRQYSLYHWSSCIIFVVFPHFLHIFHSQIDGPLIRSCPICHRRLFIQQNFAQWSENPGCTTKWRSAQSNEDFVFARKIWQEYLLNLEQMNRSLHEDLTIRKNQMSPRSNAFPVIILTLSRLFIQISKFWTGIVFLCLV